MTIIFFSRLFYPHIGGVETHVLEVAKRLVKKGHRVIVITENYQSNDKSDSITGEVEGIEIRRIDVGQDNYKKKFKIWWRLFSLRQLIKNADIVHCHDVFFWYLPFRFLYPNKKVYTTFHGYETKFPPSKKAILVRKISEKLCWGNICVGDYIRKWYGTNSDYITYGGIDVHLGGAERLMLSSPSEVPISMHNYHATVRGSYAKGIKILFIGRLEEDVGIPIYLRAMDVLNKKRVRFTFEACGDGILRRVAMKYGKVFGFVKDMDKYIERSDFVFTSSYLSILEAIYRGKIVFSVFQNKLKEDYLKMSPFAKLIVIENSPEKVAQRIEYFIKQFEIKEKIVNAGYEWVKTQTWDNVVKLYIRLWKL